MSHSSQPEPPAESDPQASMAEQVPGQSHFQQPVAQGSFITLSTSASSRLNPMWLAFGAGAAGVLGSFLPWAKVNAPFLGTMTVSGVDGSDGWVTAALGAVIAGCAVVRLRSARLSSQLSLLLSLLAVAGATALAGIGAWKIFDLEVRKAELSASLADHNDPFGLSAALSSAVQASVGVGLWLILVAGVVAAVAWGWAWVSRGDSAVNISQTMPVTQPVPSWAPMAETASGAAVPGFEAATRRRPSWISNNVPTWLTAAVVSAAATAIVVVAGITLVSAREDRAAERKAVAEQKAADDRAAAEKAAAERKAADDLAAAEQRAAMEEAARAAREYRESQEAVEEAERELAELQAGYDDMMEEVERIRSEYETEYEAGQTGG
ncbi:hypothetical protein Areg01_36910 [Actinoplanes regularis]|nr:hypothetical protein Areg01_36910 [Actinoplanes regularis]